MNHPVSCLAIFAACSFLVASPIRGLEIPRSTGQPEAQKTSTTQESHPCQIEAPPSREMFVRGNYVIQAPYSCTLIAPDELLYYSGRSGGIQDLRWKDGSFVCTDLVPIEGDKVVRNEPVNMPLLWGLTGIKGPDGDLAVAWLEKHIVAGKIRLAHRQEGKLPEIEEIWSSNYISSNGLTPIFHFFGPRDLLCFFLDSSEEHWDWRTFQREEWPKVRAIRFRDGKIVYSRFLNHRGKYDVQAFAFSVREDGSFSLVWVEDKKASNVDFSLYMQSFSPKGKPIGRPSKVLQLPTARTVIDYNAFRLAFLPDGHQALALIYGPSNKMSLYLLEESGSTLLKESAGEDWCSPLGSVGQNCFFQGVVYRSNRQGSAHLVLTGCCEGGTFEKRIGVPDGGINQSVFLIDQPMIDTFYWMEKSANGLVLRHYPIESGKPAGDDSECTGKASLKESH